MDCSAFFSSAQLVVPILSVPLNAMCSNMCAKACQTGRIVRRACIHVRVERDHRRLMTLHNEEVESVRQGELGDLFFEFLEVLRRQSERRQK